MSKKAKKRVLPPLPPGPRRGRPRHAPTQATRDRVKLLTVAGVTQPEIAAFLGIGEKALRLHYRDEIDIAFVQLNGAVAGNLYKMATGSGPGALQAAIFWLKTRAGWKEPPQEVINTGRDGGPIEYADVSARDVLASRIAGVASRLRTEEAPKKTNGKAGNGAHP